NLARRNGVAKPSRFALVEGELGRGKSRDGSADEIPESDGRDHRHRDVAVSHVRRGVRAARSLLLPRHPPAVHDDAHLSALPVIARRWLGMAYLVYTSVSREQ